MFVKTEENQESRSQVTSGSQHYGKQDRVIPATCAAEVCAFWHVTLCHSVSGS